jgi:hypothetical protein
LSTSTGATTDTVQSSPNVGVATTGGVELDTDELGVEAEAQAEFNAAEEIEELEVFEDPVESEQGTGRGAVKSCEVSCQKSSFLFNSGIHDDIDAYGRDLDTVLTL